MRLLRTLPLFVFVSALISGWVVSAQTPAVRIAEKIDESQLIMLRGNTPPAANSRNDLGPVSSSLRLTDLVLVLKRSPEQQAAFEEFVASQYDPSSPNFHRWLQPAEVGQKFGPSMTDIATITNWLASHGFAVGTVSHDRMSIGFGGTAGQVESAFHTEMHNLSVRGEKHVSNMSDPQIPAALGPVVAGVKALHNFFPRPLHRMGSRVTFNSEKGGWQRLASTLTASGTPRASAAEAKARPQFGTADSDGDVIEDVVPYDFATIYNVLPLWNSAVDGTGQTIAVAGTSDINLADVATFRSSFGLPAGTVPTIKVADGSPDPGQCLAASGTAACTIDDLEENTLDVEWAGAVAPGAKIVLVVSGQGSVLSDTVFSSASDIVNNQLASILNVSYGECELGMGTSGNSAYNALWSTAAAEGIAVFVASGDAGSAACDQGLAPADGPYGAAYGTTVNGVASTPYDTAVGGTDFNWGTAAAPYWNATNDPTHLSSAANYIPEVPWNDTCTNPLALSYFQGWATVLANHGYKATNPTNAESSCNFVNTWWQTIAENTSPTVDISGFVNTVGGGGGASSCTTSTADSNGNPLPSSCAGGYAKPSWQTGLSSIPSDGKRDLPDVSFLAGNGFLGSAYLICVSVDGACSYSAATEPIYQEVGGTSVASPAMAGVMALINQRAGTPQGSPNAQLYSLAARQTYASCTAESVKTGSSCYFNDTDSGTNAMPCASGSPNCTVSTTGDVFGVLSGYAAVTGYDEATGLGSLNVANVVQAWVSPYGLATATVNVAPEVSTLAVDQQLKVVVTVSGASGTPTGTVGLTSLYYESGAQSLVGGSYTFLIPADSLAGGNDTLSVGYSGDGTYAAATGTYTNLAVSLVAPNVTVTGPTASVYSGESLSVPVTVNGPAGAAWNGTVTLTGPGYTSAAQTISGGGYTFTIPANSLTVGSGTLTATYSGGTAYIAGSGTAGITVAASPFTLSATTPASISRGTAASSTVTVNGGTNYAGTVTLACTLNAGGPANASGDAPVCTGPTTAIALGATATFKVATTAATTAASKTSTRTAMTRPMLPGGRLAGAASAALALLVFLGIPARRRSWRAMLGAVALMVALGSLAACGGGGGSSSSGGGSSGGGGTSDPGTASGNYVFTVTATGNPAVAPAPTTTFTVTVN